jgi:hypothetical protein
VKLKRIWFSQHKNKLYTLMNWRVYELHFIFCAKEINNFEAWENWADFKHIRIVRIISDWVRGQNVSRHTKWFCLEKNKTFTTRNDGVEIKKVTNVIIKQISAATGSCVRQFIIATCVWNLSLCWYSTNIHARANV